MRWWGLGAAWASHTESARMHGRGQTHEGHRWALSSVGVCGQRWRTQGAPTQWGRVREAPHPRQHSLHCKSVSYTRSELSSFYNQRRKAGRTVLQERSQGILGSGKGPIWIAAGKFSLQILMYLVAQLDSRIPRVGLYLFLWGKEHGIWS